MHIWMRRLSLKFHDRSSIVQVVWVRQFHIGSVMASQAGPDGRQLFWTAVLARKCDFDWTTSALYTELFTYTILSSQFYLLWQGDCCSWWDFYWARGTPTPWVTCWPDVFRYHLDDINHLWVLNLYIVSVFMNVYHHLSLNKILLDRLFLISKQIVKTLNVIEMFEVRVSKLMLFQTFSAYTSVREIFVIWV